MATTSPTGTFSRSIRTARPVVIPPAVSRLGARLAWLSLALVLAGPAGAFSQITREDGAPLGRDDIVSAPLPPLDPDRSGVAPRWGQGVPGAPGPAIPDQPGVEAARPLSVGYGSDDLPVPVRDLRERLMEIAAAGEIEALRPYLETGANATSLSVTPVEGDPIEFLKSASGDGEGVEILAILLDILESGHVRMDAESDAEIFVWPYFAQVPIEGLERRELVELFQIVTAGDYREMLDLGAYYFYRIGISPDGRLEFFLAGD